MRKIRQAEAQVLVEPDGGALAEAAFKGARQAGLEEELQGGEEGVQCPMRDSCALC